MLTEIAPPPITSEIVAAMPSLRRYAHSLCRSADGAEDLMQETLLKAWTQHTRLQPGSNLNAWLFTILRNTFLNRLRKQKREVQDVDGIYSSRQSSAPAHDAVLDLHDFLAALAVLPLRQREALVLVGALGHSYDEAAVLMGAEVGTIKSRVSRARLHLMNMMQVQGPLDFASAPPTTLPTPRYACA
jgi:RNA polymerase sigma-70 factor (ECF subfamily)